MFTNKLTNNKIFLFLICFCLIDYLRCTEYKLTTEHNKRLQQAKSLRKSGLINEAKHVYKNLLIDYPYLVEALDPIKSILKKQEKWSELDSLANSYQFANNFSFKSKAETIEILIWTNNQQWEKIVEEVPNNFENKKNIELIFNALLNNNKIDILLQVLHTIRLNKSPSYFSFQLGNYYSMNMSFDKSLNEFLIYLKNNPSQRALVRSRIMTFPEIPAIQEQIKAILINSDLLNAKLILADLAFKEKKYDEALKLIQIYCEDDNEKIVFIKNLIRLKEYGYAQFLVDDILNSSTNKKILQKALIQSAKIFEDMLISDLYNLPISKNIYNNQLLNSQYLKINESNSAFLSKVIAIYDSLSIHSFDNEAPYYLAEIKYRIQGDLDGAQDIYQSIINNKRSNKFKIDSMNRLLDIMISKGDLENALNKIVSLKEVQNSKEVIESLNIKMIQVLFYQNNYEELNLMLENYLKDSKKNNPYYNDVLKIKSNLLLFFDNNEELKEYSLAMFKVYQNKRIEAINILDQLSNNENSQISEKMKYESAYLNLLQGNIDISLEILNKISFDSPYIESKLLLEAEIYDYLLYDISKAVEIYLNFLDMFPDSIYYDIIRLRLRSLTS